MGPLSAAAAANTPDPGDVNDDVTAAGHQGGSLTQGSITQGSIRRERTVRGQLDGSLAAEGAELVHVLGAVRVLRVGTPPRARHDSGVDQLQAREEPPHRAGHPYQPGCAAREPHITPL